MNFVDWFIASYIVIALPTIAIAIVWRAITLERESKKKQITDTKKDIKRIKSDNFTRNNKEKYCYRNIGKMSDIHKIGKKIITSYF